MQLVVQISTEAAQMLHDSSELFNIIGTFGISLKPMHPGTDEPVLMSYFTAEVQDGADIRQALHRLQQSAAVTAAYLKPADELP